jgi:hypothetical protein
LLPDLPGISDGLEVKFVTMPACDDAELQSSEGSEPARERFILCRSRERSKKEEGITQRFEKKIADGLTRMKARCEKLKRDPMIVERKIGKLPRKNTRAAKLFDVKVTKTDTGTARIEWSRIEAHRDWATLSAGCYLLRTNIRSLDVVLPTRSGPEIRTRCVSKPTDHQ